MRLSILVLVFFANNTLAAIPKIELFTESMAQKVKVSGNYFKGISYRNAINRRELYLRSNQDLSGYYCVTVNSIDGVYYGELIYQLENAPTENGFVRLPYPTSHIERLKKFKPDQVSVLARSSQTSDCHDDIGEVLVASWSNQIVDESAYIYLRSNARSDVIYIPSVENYTYKTKCKKMKGVYSVSYDRVCEVPLVHIGSTMEIKRKKLSKIPTYKLDVSWNE